jgi:BioD-like phosphotransacetylase family protein
MEPVHAIKYIRENTLVIVAGDRTASIVAVVNTLNKHGLNSGGIIITGGLTISAEVEDILMRSSVPVLVSESDTFTVSSGMKDLEFKIRSFDSDKILALGKMVGQHIDAETILSLLE